MTHPVVRPLVAVAATGALVVGLGLLPSGRVTGSPLAVSGTRTLACAAGDPDSLPTTVIAGSDGGIGSREVGQSPAGVTARIFLKVPARLPVVLTGGESLAGLSVGAAATGLSKGLWLAPCRAPSSDLWFPGVLSSATERASVELVNVDPTQAVVDLTILGKDGRVTVPGARGLSVPANSVRTVYLEPLVTSPDPLGVQVKASEGRVGATVRMTGDAGGDWASPTSGAATTLVIPAVPGGDGARTLVVTNPGSRRASVSVEALDAESSFAPAGAAAFEVNAESTLAVPLEAALKGSAVGLRITSTQPVASAVRVVSGGDIALVGSAAPLNSAATMPAVAGAELVITNAGDAPAAITLTTRSAEGGSIDSSHVTVEPKRSVRVPVTGDRTALFQLTTDSPDVRAALTLTKSGTATGIAIAVLGGGAASASSYDPTVDPALTR